MIKYNFLNETWLFKKISLIIICTLAGSLYCAGITYCSTFNQNICSIVFIFFLLSLFLINLVKINYDRNISPAFIFMQLLFLNLSIAATAQIIKSPNTLFWVQDSILTHLPESLKYTSFLKGEPPAQNLGIFAGRTTHALTGLFLYFFGINTFATICAQLVFKMIAAYYIYLISLFFWDRSVALIAIQLYGFCPTLFFYNLVLYKESAIHALVAASLFFAIKFFIDRKYIYLIPLILAIGILNRERFYIVQLMMIMILLLSYNLPFKKNLKNHTLILFFVSIASTCLYKFHPIHISDIINELIKYRTLHENFPDVMNQYNYDIPYPLAFIKILFSPYFSFNKFKIFVGFSTLLTWGSFLNQMIILASVMGFLKLSKEKFYHLYIWAPFIAFLLISAFITPWSGRLRDSYYPLIACYAAYYISQNRYYKQIFQSINI